jgi:hypothetical protein
VVADDPAVSERRALPYAGRQAATEDKNADELATRHQNNDQRPAIHFYSRRPVQPRFKTAGRRQGAGRKTYGSGNTIPGSAAAPSDSITGGAAGMDLALVTGTGPELLTNIDGQKPYVRPEDTVLFGYRWPDSESIARPSDPMKSFPLDAIRAQGIAESAKQAIIYLESSPTLGFWLHLDVDVLSPEWMFAVDSPDPGGLTPEELATLLKTVYRSKHCAGMQITIYDPTLDPDGVCCNQIVETLVLAFA